MVPLSNVNFIVKWRVDTIAPKAFEQGRSNRALYEVCASTNKNLILSFFASPAVPSQVLKSKYQWVSTFSLTKPIICSLNWAIMSSNKSILRSYLDCDDDGIILIKVRSMKVGIRKGNGEPRLRFSLHMWTIFKFLRCFLRVEDDDPPPAKLPEIP